MRPPIDLARTMTIQIPALEWTRVGLGFRRSMNGAEQRICPHGAENAHADVIDIEGVSVEELNWTPLVVLHVES